MLERMDDFFKKRLDGYDAHMLETIEGAAEFYPFTAAQLPHFAGCAVLDLGCGTGLELECLFALCPMARVTGIDLSSDMLKALQSKFPNKNLRLICGSYFDLPLGEDAYDAAVSVESLHHFSFDQKVGLYRRLHAALREGGYFILTDYFAESPEREAESFAQLARLIREEELPADGLYHFDTPLTVEHETQALLAAGFLRVEVLGRWSATYSIKSAK